MDTLVSVPDSRYVSIRFIAAWGLEVIALFLALLLASCFNPLYRGMGVGSWYDVLGKLGASN